MSDYRRYFVPGGTYFFTVKTEYNGQSFGIHKAWKFLA